MKQNTMIHTWLLFFITWINSSHGQQFYDATSCIKDGYAPGTRYSCTNTSFKIPCQTFLIFRSNHRFPTISTISALFATPPSDLLKLNHIGSASETLFSGREILVPVTCSCSGMFFQARFNYTVTGDTTFSDVACEVYEGLTKTITLFEENRPQEDIIKVGSILNVPLKCACPGPRTSDKYFVTYPFISGDAIKKVSKKFGIFMDDILLANNLHSDTTIYPQTTILVPLKSEPAINFVTPESPPPVPSFLPTKPVNKNVKSAKLKKIYISISAIGFFLVLVVLIISGLYINTLINKCKRDIFIIPSTRSFNSFSTPRISSPITRSSPSSNCLSPDILAGIKYSLYNLSIDEIKKATKDFSDGLKVSESVYKGLLDDVQVLIKEIDFSEIRHVIDVHSRINHINIIKLLGVCYNDSLISYLVVEYPTNGSLRDCLSNSSSFTWHRRMQIAFDIATGLHYLHYCIVPPYTHIGVGSRKVFVTAKWRAKLAVLSQKTTVINVGSSDFEKIDVLKGYEKEDVYEFGVVLIEMMSGKERIDESTFRESMEGGGEGGGYFDKVRRLMDPNLKGDYPLAEALCFAVLAKACVEIDPLHRPSMDDILKVLARMV